MKLYVSHAPADSEMAERLCLDLENAGHAPFLGERDLLPGDRRKLKIRKKIRECDAFLTLLSEKSVGEIDWFHAELEMALDIQKTRPAAGRFVIPVRIDACEDIRLVDLHSVDLFPSYEEGLAKILKGFGSEPAEDVQSKFRKQVAGLYRLMGLEVAQAMDFEDLLIAKERTKSGRRREIITLVGCRNLGRGGRLEKSLGDFANKFLRLGKKQTVDDAEFVVDRDPGPEARRIAEKDEIRLITVSGLLSSLIDFTPYFEKFVAEMEESPDRPLKTYVPMAALRLDVEKTLKKAKEKFRESRHHPESEDGIPESFDSDVSIDIKTDKWDAIPGLLDAHVDGWLKQDTSNHLSLLGDAGAGKTTFCKQLAYRLIRRCLAGEEGARIPLYIPLKWYAELGDEGGVRALVTTWLVNDQGVMADYEAFSAFVKTGKLLLILDGFDEMAMKVDDKTRKRNFELLAELAVTPNKVILTGRPGYFPSLTEIVRTLGHEQCDDPFRKIDREIDCRFAGVSQPAYDILRLDLFSDAQIEEFLEKQEIPNKKDVLSAISRYQEIRDLARRPVMLWLIVQYVGNGAITEDIDLAKLYKSFTGRWLSRDWHKGYFRQLETPEQRDQFMETLAWEMFRTLKSDVIHRGELRKRAGEWFGVENQMELDHVEHDIRVCTFLQLDKKEGYYRFIHKSFMEYLAARRIAAALEKGDCPEMEINNSVRLFVFRLMKEWKPEPFTGDPPQGIVRKDGRFFSETDGKEMVYVPPGPFIMGEGDKTRIANLKPGGFVDKYPVTNKEYAMFIQTGGYKEKKYWSDEGWKYINGQKREAPYYWKDKKWNQPDCPVVGVTWYEAEAYARWTQKVLPSEKLWEKAARGIDGRIFPWGDDIPDETRCNYRKRIRKTTPVDNYKGGKSPFGAFDMAGNVDEWCKSWYDKSQDTKAIRGGGWWDDEIRHLRSSFRFRYNPASRSYIGGFRCAKII